MATAGADLICLGMPRLYLFNALSPLLSVMREAKNRGDGDDRFHFHVLSEANMENLGAHLVSYSPACANHEQHNKSPLMP